MSWLLRFVVLQSNMLRLEARDVAKSKREKMDSALETLTQMIAVYGVRAAAEPLDVIKEGLFPVIERSLEKGLHGSNILLCLFFVLQKFRRTRNWARCCMHCWSYKTNGFPKKMTTGMSTFTCFLAYALLTF